MQNLIFKFNLKDYTIHLYQAFDDVVFPINVLAEAHLLHCAVVYTVLFLPKSKLSQLS